MSRFSEGFFDAIYQGAPPWEVGEAQPSMLALLDDHLPAGPVLDLGCGSGDLALALAGRGLQVLGIDIAEAAIEQARAKAAAAPPETARLLDFQAGDALHPSRLRRRFASVADSGFYHLFESDQRDRLVDELGATLLPGGRYYLLGFAIEFDIPNTPRRVTEDELRARFTAERGWRVVDVRAGTFLSTVAPPVAAIAACIERLAAGDG